MIRELKFKPACHSHQAQIRLYSLVVLPGCAPHFTVLMLCSLLCSVHAMLPGCAPHSTVFMLCSLVVLPTLQCLCCCAPHSAVFTLCSLLCSVHTVLPTPAAQSLVIPVFLQVMKSQAQVGDMIYSRPQSQQVQGRLVSPPHILYPVWLTSLCTTGKPSTQELTNDPYTRPQPLLSYSKSTQKPES